MTIAMQPIFTQVVPAGGSGAVVFNNIPQNFTDLKVVISARATSTTNSTGTNFIGFYLNNTTYPANVTHRSIFGNGSSVSSISSSSYGVAGVINDTNQTANSFSNNEMYIANYTSSNFKQILVDSVNENNSTTVGLRSDAVLYRESAAINRIAFDTSGSAFAAGSTFTLYGITKG